jgi:uncharacterized glyoxalase superfamily protein PhnB
MPICRRLFKQYVCLDFSFARDNAGTDIVPEQYEADAERVFRDLAEAGKIVIPLEKTFWAERFGMVVDRFGIPWE